MHITCCEIIPRTISIVALVWSVKLWLTWQPNPSAMKLFTFAGHKLKYFLDLTYIASSLTLQLQEISIILCAIMPLKIIVLFWSLNGSGNIINLLQVNFQTFLVNNFSNAVFLKPPVWNKWFFKKFPNGHRLVQKIQ